MQKLLRLLELTEKHILKLLVVGFIFIIPLYPKLPLRMINYTYIAIRLEDIYIAIVAIVFLIQVIRKKVQIPMKLAIFFIAYWIAVFASFIYGYYVQNTIIIDHLGFLHSARRIEYMIIFFVALSIIKTKKDLIFYLRLIFAVCAIVSIYGLGQKFLGWPAVQTMNPEYAKGYFLVLESWSRISSTFAGHYDLGGYLILLIPCLLGFYLYSGSKKYFFLFFIILGALVLSASRASYIAYVVSISAYLLLVRKFKLLIIVLVATAILTPLSNNLSNRLSRTFQQTRVFVDSETGKSFVARNFTPDDLPPGDFGSNTDLNSAKKSPRIILDPKTELDVKEQIRDSLLKEARLTGKQLTPEEISASVDAIFLRQIPISKYLPDISISTRLQVSWPRAIGAFQKNILLGSGPSSLGEATDGDYFRWLGELGLVGTGLFLLILGIINIHILKNIFLMGQKEKYLFYGFIFGFFGLFINAGYIDLFEASKLAYYFWLLAALYYKASDLFIHKKDISDLKI